MTEQDASAFRFELQRLANVFRPPAKLDDLAAEYWRVLEPLPLLQLRAKVSRWIDTADYFPKPHELKQTSVPVTTHQPTPQLTDDERQQYLDAKRDGFERSPCTCLECHEAQVDERPRRFVPEDSTLLGIRPGQWIHGHDLAAWYLARASFYEQFHRLRSRL